MWAWVLYPSTSSPAVLAMRTFVSDALRLSRNGKH